MSRVLQSLIFTAFLCTQTLAQTLMPTLTPDQLDWLGQRIYENECNRQSRCLTSWNAGEDFPSLGLGHFIWYRAGQQEAFVETFPALLSRMQSEGMVLPGWIELYQGEQPWPDRESFLAAMDGPELSALRELLQHSMPLQTRFIVDRFEASLSALLDSVPAAERPALEKRIRRILAEDAHRGSYALIDYVHFKGDGNNPSERYAGLGWGLLQVLRGMPENSSTPLADFVASAQRVLAQRVAAAPPERNEQRWLAGWTKRLGTYLDAHPAATGL
jgi:hypothetical protein